YQIGDKSKKKLVPGQSVSNKVKELFIVCKNMRVLSFGFKDADKDNGRQIANGLLHHAYPKRHPLLFMYDIKEPYNKPITKEARLYVTAEDWRKDLTRCKAKKWRISDVNKNFSVTLHMPEYLVVPETITNSQISTAARDFRNEGFPVWVWGTEHAALVRMPDLLPSLTDRVQENILITQVHKSHPRTQPIIVDLSRDCPTPKEVQSSYSKLKNLCTPDSVRVYKAQDFKFYGLLDQSKWLHHISMCLSKAVECAKVLVDDTTTVILQEDKGEDMNCVVSSLIQLLLDHHWRTRKGFQSLIQKEWVALGHPFAFRLGHILDPDIEPSFLFLLFLDCVWQMLQQFPTAFQFSETYLTTIWDSSHITIFETFLFNSEHSRFLAGKQSTLRSVWNWSEQFSESDITLFDNPLYERSNKERLIPSTGISCLDVWRQCYFRWIPDLEIRNGGRPQIDICNRFLSEELELLRHKLATSNFNGAINKTKEEKLQILRRVNSFYPFSHNCASADQQLNNQLLLSSDALETQSIYNLATD
ncbi:PREDICTED: myotubularin-related protein 10-B-like, partial [Nicrophorus vespilloides]